MASTTRRKAKHEALSTSDDEESRVQGASHGMNGDSPSISGGGGGSSSSSEAMDPSSDLGSDAPCATDTPTPPAATTTITATATSVVSSLMNSEQGQMLVEQIDNTIKPAIHNFFYPQHRTQEDIAVNVDSSSSSDADYGYGANDVEGENAESAGGAGHPAGSGGGGGDGLHRGSGGTGSRTNLRPQIRCSWDAGLEVQIQEDRRFVHHFWRTYDDIIILSLFTQIGILFRLAISTYFTYFDNVFSSDSALFVNLPLNSLSCFILGLLCSGERLMEIISTRFTPPRLQQDIVHYDDDDNDGDGDEDHDDRFVVNLDRRSQRQRLLRRDDEEEGDHHDDGVYENYGNPRQAACRQRPQRRRQRKRLRGTKGHHHSIVMTDEVADDADEADDDNNHDYEYPSALRHRKFAHSHRPRKVYFHSWQPPVQLNSELREVQLLALERRIRASKCLLLFPVRKEDVDVMEHYFQEGYSRRRGGRAAAGKTARRRQSHNVAALDESESGFSGRGNDLAFDLELQEEEEDETERVEQEHSSNTDNNTRKNRLDPTTTVPRSPPSAKTTDLLRRSKLQRDNINRNDDLPDPLQSCSISSSARMTHLDELDPGQGEEDGQLTNVPLEESHSNNTTPTTTSSSSTSVPPDDPATVTTTANQTVEEDDSADAYLEEIFQDVQANVSRLRRVNLADGWDVGVTPDDMADDLMLGLRDGFCGALSSFSSWNSAMVNLMKTDQIGEAFVGYMIGVQLPIIAYRFGQHVAVFIFTWRCRFETRRDERRGGYGIRLSTEGTERDEDDDDNEGGAGKPPERKIPSVRAIATAIFVMALVTQCTSLSFFNDPDKQLIAMSLLFSPLGVLARWRLSKLNGWRPNFPLGTFACNIIACALSGSLGNLLAGNPGPRERIVLVGIISGFGGTLSSLAAFIVEILAGLDPVLFRFDGVIYAMLSIFWAWVVGFVFSSTADWADQTS